MFPTLHEFLNAENSDEDVSDRIADLINEVGSSSFKRWYQVQEFKQNIQNGQSYFNHPSSPSEPLRHNPSQLLQCHRKMYYRQHNAPQESEDPTGIFWIGEKFETELIVPFLQDISNEEIFVQNSIWIDFTIRSHTGDLRIKGETDPAFVDVEGVPYLLTEIKTKDSIDQLDAPNVHHLAQAHAYMYGLSQKFDRRITDVLLIYADRSTLDLKVFHSEFDPVFWRNDVLEWTATHSEYRIDKRLPPPTPEYSWECKFCSYRERCGKETDSIFTDSPPLGFLPLHQYPESAVTTHLEAHQDAGVRLTPTLAHQFPAVAEEYNVYDWECQSCEETFKWDTFKPDGESEFKSCPECGSAKENIRGPTPEEQQLREEEYPTNDDS